MSLSRKARKKLERVVVKKQLKVDRKNILDELKRCQLEPEQLDRMHSTSSMQTKGLKRFINHSNDSHRVDEIERAEKCLDASILIRRKRRKIAREAVSSSSSSSEDTDAISTDSELDHVREQKKDINSDTQLDDLELTESTSELKEDEINTKNLIEPDTKDIKNDKSTRKKLLDKLSRPSQPAVFVPVTRDASVEEARLKLPIIGEEQRIMESIRYNDIVLVCGETGSGKTTQIPQFLYEAGYALENKLIGITEPRRVAAISMSERVAKELNLTADEVSYQIRFSGNVSESTRIKFMTDGVLLRECKQDFLLSKYSVIIIDEAHERSVFSDILIGLLSRIVPLRAKRGIPLKIVIMSATLRVSDFLENNFLFPKPPPLIKIEARQYPVTMKFAKRTPKNYLKAAFKKVCSIHSRLPRGGILVFVTSQMDVKYLCKKLKVIFPKNQNSLDKKEHPLQFLDSDSSDSDSDEDGIIKTSQSPLHCLGLYAMLPIEKQKLVFNDPPDGSRLCVIATNVAETSITIPNIKYVVDTGMEKSKFYDLVTGVSRFKTTWTSKSSAEQRAGRAGRMGPGHCYRLYSSAVYTNDFVDHTVPQILRKPVDDVLLQMKSMNIDNVVNFPFPTRPSLEALIASEKKLVILGALEDKKTNHVLSNEKRKSEYSSRLTSLGKAMSNFAIGARCSKMMVLSPPELLPNVIALVSALTVREMLLPGKDYRPLRKKWLGTGSTKLLGDYAVMLKAVFTADTSGCSINSCSNMGLRMKAMLEIDKLRKQLVREVNSNSSYPNIDLSKKLKRPTDAQATILRQLLLSSFCDHVARKLPDGEVSTKDPDDPNKVIKRKLKNAYECMEIGGPVYISSDSILKNEHHEYIIYKELYQSETKTYMRDVAVIESSWLLEYAKNMCNCEKSKFQVIHGQIKHARVVTYGPLNWPVSVSE